MHIQILPEEVAWSFEGAHLHCCHDFSKCLTFCLHSTFKYVAHGSILPKRSILQTCVEMICSKQRECNDSSSTCNGAQKKHSLQDKHSMTVCEGKQVIKFSRKVYPAVGQQKEIKRSILLMNSNVYPPFSFCGKEGGAHKGQPAKLKRSILLKSAFHEHVWR